MYFSPLWACLGRCRPLLVHIIVLSETEFDDVMIEIPVFLFKREKKKTYSGAPQTDGAHVADERSDIPL